MSPYVRVLIAVFCLVVPVYAPGAPDKTQAPAQDQKSTTVAARRETLAALLNSAGKFRQTKETLKAVLALNEAGHLQMDLDQSKEALATFQQSYALVNQATDPITTIDTLNGLASTYVELNQYDKAEPFLEEARTLSEQNNYPAGKAEALLLLSVCQNNKNHVLALSTANEAMALWQSIGNNPGILRTHLRIGLYHFAQNSLPEATQSFEAARDLAHTLGDATLKAESLIYLGYVEFRKSAWQEMMAFYDSAEKLLNVEAEAKPYLLGQITSGLAEGFLEIGLPEVGLQKYQQALEYFRLANSPSGRVGMLWGIGRSLYLDEKYPEASTTLQQALAEAEASNLKGWIASSHEYLGRTDEALNQNASALAHYEIARTLYSEMGNPMESARVTALLGQAYQAQGKLDKARELYQQALQAFEAIDHRLNQSATLFALGRLEIKSGNYESAENYFRQSIEVTENVRSMSSSRDLTAAFSATVHDRYEQYIQCLMRGNQKQAAVQAFEISESARARSLAEFLRATDTKLLATLDQDLSKQEESLRKLLRAKEDARVDLLTKQYQREELARLDAELAQLNEQYKSLTAVISSRYPTYNQITRPRGWDLARIQEQVISDDNTLLLEYILGADKSYVWAVSRHSFNSYEIQGETINKTAEAVYEFLKEPKKADDENDLAQSTQQLAQMVLSPVAEHLNKRRIIVVSDGALNYIPFQILPSPSSNSEPLVARHEIINAPSASILGELRAEAAGRGVRSKVLAAFGNPAFSHSDGQRKETEQIASTQTQQLDHLRYALRDIELNGDTFDPSVVGELFFAEREIASLRDIASPAETFTATGYAANRDQLFSMDFSQYAILHFATHGLLDAKRPEHSGLLLATINDQGQERQGFIGLQDIYSLRAPVDLVVLSACRTGLGKDIRGEGLVGLTRGFMYAGATTVVASLWKVDDEATSELMKYFYSEMLQNQKTPGEALRAAQNRIRQIPRWSAPHYWAGFTLQGEYQFVVNSSRGWRRYSTVIAIGILILLAGAAAGWYRYRLRKVYSTVKK